MKLTRLKVVAIAMVAALGIGAVAFWLHREASPSTEDDPTAATEDTPAPSRTAVRRNVMEDVDLMVTYLSADNREGARQLAQATASDITIADAMNILRDTRTRSEHHSRADWSALRHTAYQTVAVAELMLFLPPPNGPSPTWNALRQELKEASYDFRAAVLSRDVEQAQRASLRLHTSCVECHQRFQHVPVRLLPIPIDPSHPEPTIDFSAFSGELSMDVRKAAEFMMHGEYANGRAWTEQIAKKTNYEDVMALFESQKHGGLGVTDRPGDAIEESLLELEKKLPANFERGEMEAMAYRVAATAEMLKALPPSPKMEEAEWRRWTLLFRNAAFDLALVLHDRDAGSITRAAARLNETCAGCHGKADVPAVAERPRRKSTADLLAILEGRPDDEAKGAVYLSRKRAKMIDELVHRKDELAKLGAPLKKALRGSLEDPDASTRLRTIELIASCADDIKDSALLLRGVLDDEKDEEVRLAVTQILARLKAPDAVTGLIHALEDEDPIVRGRAGIALSRLGKNAVPELRKLLKTGNRDTRASTLGTLARIGGDARDSVPDLLALLKDDDPLLQKLAAEALGKIDPRAAEKARVK